MEGNQSQAPRDGSQLNPGQKDQFGHEVVIKKNEGISEQGNEWSDQEESNLNREGISGDKAEKYIKDSADIEDQPKEQDLAATIENAEHQHVVDDDDGENSDDVIEDKGDSGPGFDLGRNKVQKKGFD